MPYAVDRELEDVAATIAVAGGEAAVYDNSSGATLALFAAADGLPITKLIAYEPPFIVEGLPDASPELRARVEALVADGRPGDAAELFMRGRPGMPDEVIAGMKAGPGWSYFENLAPRLPYDLAITGDQVVPAARFATIDLRTLAIAGGGSPEWTRASVAAVADAIGGSGRPVIDGQDHNVDPEPLAPHVKAFLKG